MIVLILDDCYLIVGPCLLTVLSVRFAVPLANDRFANKKVNCSPTVSCSETVQNRGDSLPYNFLTLPKNYQ